MSGPTPYAGDGKELFTEERPAVVILGDLLKYIEEMRQMYDDTQELYQVLQDNLSFIGSGSPKGVYSTLSALQTAKPTGDTNIYVVTSDGKWYYWNGTAWVAGGVYQATQLTDGSVTIAKTDFIEYGLNLFDKNDSSIINGSYYNYQGVVTTSVNHFITGKINVKPNDVFTIPYGSADFADSYWGAYFDQNGNRIGNVSAVASGAFRTITVPNNSSIAYMKLNALMSLKQNMMVVKGTSYPVSYIPFSVILKNNKNNYDIVLLNERVDLINTNFVDSANLFNKNSVDNESGYFINYQGNKTALAGVFITHKINTLQNEIITIKHYNTFGSNPMALYYDDNNNVLSYLKGTLSGDAKSATFITPTNTSIRKVKFNGVLSDIDNFMVVKGNTLPLYYIPFEKTLAENFGLNTRQLSYLPKNNLLQKIAVFDGDSICNAINDAKDGWAGRISTQNNMSYTNYAVDGGTITAGLMAGSNPRHWISRSISGYRNDADYIILEGGTNDADLIGVNNMGAISVGFNVELDDTVFTGAVESTLKQVILKYPNKKIGFIIAHKMGSMDQQIVRRAFFDRIIECCKKWGVPYLDLWQKSYINPEITELKNMYYSDNQHLTTAGYDLLTPLIEDWMKTL